MKKFCTKCKVEKQLEEFSRKSSTKDGHSARCKKCISEDGKPYRIANKDKISATSMAWAKANPEKTKLSRDNRKEQIKIKNDAYYQNNKETVLARQAKRYAENKSKVYGISKKWYLANYETVKAKRDIHRLNNPEIYRAKNNKRRALINNANGSHTSSDIKNLMNLQNCKCPVCNVDIKNKYHIDHVIPLSNGGSNDVYNLQLLCPLCNLEKGKKHPVDFMQSRGFLL